MSDKPEELETDEDYVPLLDDPDVVEILAFAATGLTDIFTNVPEEDLDNTTVVINAGKISDCLELLLMYAECYEGLDVDELTASSLLDRSIGSYNYGSDALH